jgi:N-acetylglucosaminyldiphosphoundecaprenol N-acetyl-beta-D-mannosaminyltransferase
MQTALTERRRLLVTHVNVHGLHIACRTPWYRDFLNASDITYCDGMGVQLGARLLGERIPERYTLADWYPQLMAMLAENEFSVYLLGSRPEVVQTAAENLQARFPHLQIAGTQHGYFDHARNSEENRAVVAAINAAQPDFLMVGMGMPLQERWLMENWANLQVNVALTCGAIFEYMAGVMRHGPAWMTQNYLEWLFRLIDRPNRYAKRYLVENPLFLLRVLRQRLFGLSSTFL